jgi:MerR family copper efflux transcriptional regulator
VTDVTIGKLASAAGVGVETVRFYQRQGLMPQPPRSGGGFRRYDEDAVERLRFIRHAQDLGFSLKEVGELLDLQDDPTRTRLEVRQIIDHKLADLDLRIAELRRMQAALLAMRGTCHGDGSTADCAILHAMRDGPEDLHDRSQRGDPCKTAPCDECP